MSEPTTLDLWSALLALLRQAIAEGVAPDLVDASLTIQQNDEAVSVIGSLTIKKPAPPES
jgi:hypothetical protein